jgi:hypothetical protein
MPRRCTVCTRDDRDAIDRALVGGTPYRGIARRWPVSADALARHHDEHLPAHLAEAHAAREVADADKLLARLQRLLDTAEGLLARAAREGDYKAADVYRARGAPVPPTAESALRLELANGSRIISLPGRDDSTIRGYSGVRLLVVDEASRVADALYMSVRPMLAVSGGRLLALSTPFGTRGWWYEAWRSEEPWERYEVPATDCPRIPAEFLEEERRSMGDWWYRQEYGCEFMDAQDAVFRQADIAAAITSEVAPLFGSEVA